MSKAERRLMEYYETESVLNELDNFPVIEDAEKLDILGVFCDIKPFGTVYVFNGEGLEKTKKMFEEMELRTNVIFYRYYGYDSQYKIWMAKNEETLKKAGEIYKMINFDKGNKEAQLEIGRLYGYPETSNQAFIEHRPRLTNETEQQLRRKNLAILFSNHVLSQDNYKEEIEVYGEKIMLATKEYLPNTYKKIVEKWRREIFY